MLSKYHFSYEQLRGRIVLDWCTSILILWNIILIIAMGVTRRKASTYQIPEDVKILGGQLSDSANDWSIHGRIKRCLANNIEYVAYFLILYLLFGFQLSRTYVNSRFKAEVYHYKRYTGYGVVMIFARILHNLSYIFRNSYGRISGHMITIILLVIMIVDLCYNMSHLLATYKPTQP
jgi:uncharacterized membrane protein YecN with MAPEG domain